MTTLTKDALLALLKRKRLNDLASELEEDSITFEDMMNFTKEDWEKQYKLKGVAIYYHLHPSPQSSRNGSKTCLSIAAPR